MTWILRADNGDLTPGTYKARLVRNGPYAAIRVIAPMIDGQLVGDVVLHINGQNIPATEWMRRFPVGLVGEPITEAEYRHQLAESEWGRDKLGLRDREQIDIRRLPPVLP